MFGLRKKGGILDSCNVSTGIGGIATGGARGRRNWEAGWGVRTRISEMLKGKTGDDELKTVTGWFGTVLLRERGSQGKEKKKMSKKVPARHSLDKEAPGSDRAGGSEQLELS